MTVDAIVNYVLKTPLNTNRAILTSMLQELQGSGSSDVVQLRRDNDYNYDKIADVFIPASGEICLVDTARDGLRFKCGDGVTVWKDLEYIDSSIVKGYYFEGNFYKDMNHTQLISGAIQKLYIDLTERVLYFYDGEQYVSTSGKSYGPATELEAGVAKLYQSVGDNIDGSMSQKAITDELDDKVEILLKKEEETLVFVI